MHHILMGVLLNNHSKWLFLSQQCGTTGPGQPKNGRSEGLKEDIGMPFRFAQLAIATAVPAVSVVLFLLPLPGEEFRPVELSSAVALSSLPGGDDRSNGTP